MKESFPAAAPSHETVESQQEEMVRRSISVLESLRERIASPLGKALATAALLTATEGCSYSLPGHSGSFSLGTSSKEQAELSEVAREIQQIPLSRAHSGNVIEEGGRLFYVIGIPFHAKGERFVRSHVDRNSDAYRDAYEDAVERMADVNIAYRGLRQSYVPDEKHISAAMRSSDMSGTYLFGFPMEHIPDPLDSKIRISQIETNGEEDLPEEAKGRKPLMYQARFEEDKKQERIKMFRKKMMQQFADELRQDIESGKRLRDPGMILYARDPESGEYHKLIEYTVDPNYVREDQEVLLSGLKSNPEQFLEVSDSPQEAFGKWFNQKQIEFVVTRTP